MRRESSSEDPRLQAVRESPAKQLLPQDPTACSLNQAFLALVPRTRRGERRTNRAFARQLSE
jgi:hypothetical protein